MKPYYDAEGITVYHARWEDVLAAGLVKPRVRARRAGVESEG